MRPCIEGLSGSICISAVIFSSRIHVNEAGRRHGSQDDRLNGLHAPLNPTISTGQMLCGLYKGGAAPEEERTHVGGVAVNGLT